MGKADARAKIYISDFETTVDSGAEQKSTEVWAAATICLEDACEPDKVKIYGSIDDFMAKGIRDISLYHPRIDFFHNLKFDGSFILTWLMEKSGLTHWVSEGDGESFIPAGKMPKNSFTYCISATGIWYSITIKINRFTWRILDSLKILPFTVRKIGKDFQTKFQKLEMEYEGERYANCPRTVEEDAYIRNDVLVMHEAIGWMRKNGQEKSTIAGCAMADFRIPYDDDSWDHLYPNLYEEILDEKETAGDWLRKSYHGGWCYVMPSKAGKVWRKGCTCDVNSLYPSMMLSASGNRYPVAMPTWWHGDKIPDDALKNSRYYFIRVRTRFRLKKGKLPTIQIKDDPLYPPREWLERSDLRLPDGRWASCYRKGDRIVECIPTLTLTMTDWELMQDHYDLYDTEIIEGCYFETALGLFDSYISKWAEVKKREKGAKRALAKLMLNSLYGRFAMSIDSSYQILHLNQDGGLRSSMVEKYDKTPGYIPIGSAITSYARAFTIRAAQKNYEHFIYADTDSIHCHCGPDKIVGCPEHESDFLCWKYEAQWEVGWFVRQKTYAEYVCGENREPVEPYWNIKCAGMPERARKNFIFALTDTLPEGAEWEKLTDDERDWLSERHERAQAGSPLTIEDFKVGLKVPGSLKAKRIKGGTLLIPGEFVLRPRLFKVYGESD